VGVVRGVLAAMWPSMLGGACFFLCAAFAQGARGGQALGALLIGGFAGLLVLGLIRLFPVARWTYPIVGILVGPLLPLLVYARSGQRQEEAAGALWVLGAFFGAVIGLLEWGRRSRAQEREGEL
jgi:hypothetical protein